MKKPNKPYTCYGMCYCDYTPSLIFKLQQITKLKVIKCKAHILHDHIELFKMMNVFKCKQYNMNQPSK